MKNPEEPDFFLFSTLWLTVNLKARLQIVLVQPVVGFYLLSAIIGCQRTRLLPFDIYVVCTAELVVFAIHKPCLQAGLACFKIDLEN